MSIIRMPSLAMLLVLTNFALCLSVERQKLRPDPRRLTAMAFPEPRPGGTALTTIVPLRID